MWWSGSASADFPPFLSQVPSIRVGRLHSWWVFFAIDQTVASAGAMLLLSRRSFDMDGAVLLRSQVDSRRPVSKPLMDGRG